MILKINNTDISSMVAVNGVAWSQNDIDGPDAGRTLDGLMWRDRVTSKIKLEVTCTPLNSANLKSLLALLSPEYVTVQYFDPYAGSNQTKTMYCSTRKAALMLKLSSNSDLWENITFSLIER